MKILLAVTCLLAAATIVRGMDQDALIAKYMEYLTPDLTPCAEEFHITQEQATNIQQANTGVDARSMGCLKACVMKRMSILIGTDFHLEPIYTMIEKVHADNPEEIQSVRQIASSCTEGIKGESDECNIGNKYTDCYIEKLFSA